MVTRISARAVCLMLAVTLAAAGCNRGGGTEQPSVQPSPTTVAAPASPSPSPSPAAETYTVESGDTLSDIARRFDTTVEAIVELNELDDPDVLNIGDELVIPPEQ